MATKARQSLFGWSVLKHKVELLPLVGFIGVACLGAGAYMAYSLYQKPDVSLRFSKSAEQPPWEMVNPEQSQKFLSINQKYQKIPELEALRKEIGSYKY